MTYKTHLAATLFPLMSEDEYQGMKQDIAENGQQEPIILWGDEVLDGRNRLRACKELGRKPAFVTLDSSIDPWKYVISHNLHRRHLSTSQRAAVAAKLATFKHGGDRKSQEIKTQNCALIDEAANALNVSPRSVNSARKVQENGSKAVQTAVERGDTPVSLAAKLVTVVPDKVEQTKIVAKGLAAVRKAVKNPQSTVPEPTKREKDLEAFRKAKSAAKQHNNAMVRFIDTMNEIRLNPGAHREALRHFEAMDKILVEWPE
jgi:hypothetical protein